MGNVYPLPIAAKPHRFTHSPENDEAFLRLANAGMTRGQICDALGCAPSTATELAKRTGFAFPSVLNTRAEITDEQAKWLRAHTADGGKIRDACEHIGLSRNAITRIAREMGLKFLNTGNMHLGKAMTDERRAEVDQGRVPQMPEWADKPLSGEEPIFIYEIDRHSCKWPLGDPLTPEFRYCGARVCAGLVYNRGPSPYCETHLAVSSSAMVRTPRQRELVAELMGRE